MRALIVPVVLLALAAPAAAKTPLPGLAGGGSLPLGDVVAIAKPYPNLVLQIRLQLVRAGTSADKVVCTGRRYSNMWTALGGAKAAPYECQIGRRTLAVSANQTYFDRNGHRLNESDPDLPRKAVRVQERALSWRWK